MSTQSHNAHAIHAYDTRTHDMHAHKRSDKQKQQKGRKPNETKNRCRVFCVYIFIIADGAMGYRALCGALVFGVQCGQDIIGVKSARRRMVCLGAHKKPFVSAGVEQSLCVSAEGDVIIPTYWDVFDHH